MTFSPRLRFVLLPSAILAGALAVAAPAQAGGLRVRDDAHVLTADDASRLRAVLAAAPFDGSLAVTNVYPDAEELSHFAHSLVNEPNMVAVAVDPQHRHVQVHFGTGSRVPRGEWAGIERAGTDDFRRGDWEGGAAAIFRAAANAAAASGAGEAVPVAPEQARPSFFGPGLLFLLLAGGIAVAYFAWRRSTYGGGYGGPTYGPPGGPYGGPGYPPGYPGGAPQGGMGPLGGGLIGAGLGGLAGYELGKLEGEREERDRDMPVERGGVVDDGGDFDAGGGGSSWDDGGGDGGGGFDGGGDSGGGSDF